MWMKSCKTGDNVSKINGHIVTNVLSKARPISLICYIVLIMHVLSCLIFAFVSKTSCYKTFDCIVLCLSKKKIIISKNLTNFHKSVGAVWIHA